MKTILLDLAEFLIALLLGGGLALSFWLAGAQTFICVLFSVIMGIPIISELVIVIYEIVKYVVMKVKNKKSKK